MDGHPGRTVLVVDDEEMVRNFTSTFLEHQGHECLKAATGEEGLSLLREQAKVIDLALVDFKLPDMAGSELVERMAEIRPDMPVILTTGYGVEIAESFGGCYPQIKAILAKPFKPSQLTDLIDAVVGF
jgi:DNA-binding NtrC family response regulator